MLWNPFSYLLCSSIVLSYLADLDEYRNEGGEISAEIEEDQSRASEIKENGINFEAGRQEGAWWNELEPMQGQQPAAAAAAA